MTLAMADLAQQDPDGDTPMAESSRQAIERQAATQSQPNFQLTASLVAHSRGVSSVKFSPDGEWLATGGAEGVVHLWRIDTWIHIYSLKGHTAGINDIAFTANSLYVATASDDNTARIWVVKSGKCVRTLAQHTSHVTCLAFNPKCNVLATGSWDERVILWDVKSGTVLRELPAHSDPLTAVSFNIDGTMLVSSSYDGLMRLWDASTGQCLKSIEDEQNSPVSFADFTPNGAYIIASSLSSSIRIWSYHTSKSFKTYTGHRNQKFCCPAVIVDPTMSAGEEATDAWVIAGSEIEDGKAGATGEVVIWGLQGRQVLQRLSEHKDTVVALAAHPTRLMLASGSLERDKVVPIWEHVPVDAPPANGHAQE